MRGRVVSPRAVARPALVILAALVALGGARAAAQERVVCGHVYDGNHPRAWKAVEERFSAELDAGREPEVHGRLVAEFLASDAQRDGAVRDRFVRAALRIGRTPGQGCPAFKLDPGPPFAPNLTLFTGDERIEFPPLCATPEGSAQADEIRYYAMVLEELCLRVSAPGVSAVRDRIAKLDEDWDRFLFEGYPMFPWEAAVNGWWFHKEMAEGPPDKLVALLHPSPAVTLGTRTFRDADPDLALSLDLIGYVRYRESGTARTWWGITVLAGIANDRGLGLGLGAMYGPMRLGVVFYDDDANGQLKSERPSVLLGVDLYKYLGKTYRKYEKTREKLEEAKKKLKGSEP